MELDGYHYMIIRLSNYRRTNCSSKRLLAEGEEEEGTLMATLEAGRAGSKSMHCSLRVGNRPQDLGSAFGSLNYQGNKRQTVDFNWPDNARLNVRPTQEVQFSFLQRGRRSFNTVCARFLSLLRLTFIHCLLLRLNSRETEREIIEIEGNIGIFRWRKDFPLFPLGGKY